MKKRISLLLITLVLFLVFEPKLFAVCTDLELNDIAEDLNVFLDEDLEIIGENDKVERERKYLYLLSFGETLSGKKDKVKIEVTDSENSKKYNATYDTFYDTYVIGSLIHFTPKTYNITIYGGDKSKCPNEKIKAFSYKVNAYNIYRDSEYCQTHKEEDVCSIDFDSSNLNDEEFNKLVNPTVTPELTFFQKVWNVITSYWYFVVIPVVVISIFYLVIIFIYKKKGSKE